MNLNKEIEELEFYKEGIKYYQVMRNLNNKTPQKALKIKNGDGKLVLSELGQVNEITKHFKMLFAKRDITNEIPNITPEEIKPSFSGTEVYKNSCKLKNNKSPDVYTEMVKYAPIKIL